MQNFDLEWIRSFVSFAEAGGVEEAAIKIGITQPAISQHLAKLESSVGSPIFERDGRRKILNQNGKALYIQLSRNLKSINEVLRSAQFKTAEEEQVTLRLG